MPGIGDPAPLFSGEDFLSGQSFSLSDHQGDVVLIAFNGITWCGPCKFEAPILQSLWEEFQDGYFAPHVQFVMISTWDNLDLLPGALQQYGITMPVVTDPSIPGLYEVTAVPALFVANTEGKICATKVGAGPPESVVRDEIRQLLLECGAHPALHIQLPDWFKKLLPPWEPIEHIAVEKRDALLALAMSELAGQIQDSPTRRDLEMRSLRAAESAIRQLRERRSRKPLAGAQDRMPPPSR
jgi:thiol-disulfide isomerase/thioredoxin